MARMTESTTTEPRVRFNWGFWDGVSGSWAGRSVAGHYDRYYAAGVTAGEAAARAGEQPDSSEAAWLVHAA